MNQTKNQYPTYHSKKYCLRCGTFQGKISETPATCWLCNQEEERLRSLEEIPKRVELYLLAPGSRFYFGKGKVFILKHIEAKTGKCLALELGTAEHNAKVFKKVKGKVNFTEFKYNLLVQPTR